jgi:ElaB/YqjD/DUF883 family membrane-anchored ribosome-binding protein
MSFTEQDRLNQEKKVAELTAEFDRLNAQFEAQLKAAGLTEADLAKIDLDNPPPELKAALAEARRQAERAGRERADQTRPAASGAPKPGARGGTLRA